MITYKTTDFETTTDLREAINTDLADLAYPIAVTHKMNGQGRVVSIKAPLAGDSLYVNIDFDSIGSKMFSLKTLFEYRLIEMPEDVKAVLMEAQTAIESDYTEIMKAIRETNRLAYEQKKQAEEDKKAEAKYQASRARILKEFQTLLSKERPISGVNEFYYCLGWIAKNCGAFSATIPDYCLSDFQRKFGTDYEPHLVDGRAKTSGNNPMKYAESMKTAIKKAAQNMVPALLTKYLSKSGTSLSDSDFVCELVANYGFQFGKTQNIEMIRSKVPADFIESFESGLV